MVFLFSGAALALCVPTFGAFLFLACWLPVRSSWVGFGLAGSGRAALDQGSFWLFFWVASLAPGLVTWILPKCTKKQMGLGIFMRKERLAESLHASLSVPKAAVFSSVYRILAGTVWFKMSSFVPNSAFHLVFVAFCSVPFVGAFWVGWLAVAGWGGSVIRI